MDQQSIAALWSLANSIGVGGLAFVTWALMRGHLITRREYDGVVTRCERLEQKLDKAIEYGHRAVGASERLIEKQNG